MSTPSVNSKRPGDGDQSEIVEIGCSGVADAADMIAFALTDPDVEPGSQFAITFSNVEGLSEENAQILREIIEKAPPDHSIRFAGTLPGGEQYALTQLAEDPSEPETTSPYLAESWCVLVGEPGEMRIVKMRQPEPDPRGGSSYFETEIGNFLFPGSRGAERPATFNSQPITVDPDLCL